MGNRGRRTHVSVISHYEPVNNLELATFRSTTLKRVHNTPDLGYGKVQLEIPCGLTLGNESAFRPPSPPSAPSAPERVKLPAEQLGYTQDVEVLPLR